MRTPPEPQDLSPYRDTILLKLTYKELMQAAADAHTIVLLRTALKQETLSPKVVVAGVAFDVSDSVARSQANLLIQHCQEFLADHGIELVDGDD